MNTKAEPNRESYAQAQVSAMIGPGQSDLVYIPETGEFLDWPSGIDGHHGIVLFRNASDTGYDTDEFPNEQDWVDFFMSQEYYTEWLDVLWQIDQLEEK